ncbi:hypothetical protein M422DRAFT_273728 [Sphaerobolus stellatus SS14]|uniref:Uncharacterized protein n=1 Tax=Sphaerobolus stellatus (strain SS14) TaxID=990650 RepID=A0A0C9UJ77_SPHS4|nr:hypothetical protein M422DRAFT_273728 [Sphaerobolus stellatus SS14]
MVTDLNQSSSKRYLQDADRVSWRRPIAEPDYQNGGFFRVGDVLFESEGGMNLDRVVNACVSHDHALNQENSVVVPEFNLLENSPKHVHIVRVSSPLASVHAKYTFTSRARMNVDRTKINYESSINILRTKHRGAVLIYEPHEAPEFTLKSLNLSFEWILENLTWVETHAKRCGFYPKMEGDGLRFLTGAVHVEKWAWVVWKKLNQNIELNLGIDPKVSGEGEEPFWKNQGLFIKMGLLPQTPDTIGPATPQDIVDANENLVRNHDNSEQNKPEGDPYIIWHNFARPQTILFSGFKHQRKKRSKESSGSPTNLNMSWTNISLEDIDGSNEEESDSEESESDDSDVDSSSSISSSSSSDSHKMRRRARKHSEDGSPNIPIDKLNDPDEVILRYLLGMSPADVTHALIHSECHSRKIQELSYKDGYENAIGAWLVHYQPEIVVREGVNVKIAYFTHRAFVPVYLYGEEEEEEEREEEESVRATLEAERTSRRASRGEIQRYISE